MAGIEVGAAGRRAHNRDLPLVPFIDFLLCLIAFLLVTAVWMEHGRLSGSADVPGAGESPGAPSQRLHVSVQPGAFELKWLRGSTVVDTARVPRRAERRADGSLSYPELAAALSREWSTHGTHRHPSDPRADEAVLHVQNSTEYGELAAVLDALHAPRRQYPSTARGELQPVFSVTFAVN